MADKGLTHAEAGVDIDAGNRTVELPVDNSSRTSARPRVVEGVAEGCRKRDLQSARSIGHDAERVAYRVRLDLAW
jgi:hypothetical protein